MKTKQLDQIKSIIQDLEKNYDFNDYILNYIDETDLKDCKTSSDVRELIEKANEDQDITRTEVIYYSNAIEYLKENDPSLQESMEIANDLWYETKSLNSELLASLLSSENNYNDFSSFLDDLENQCDEILF